MGWKIVGSFLPCIVLLTFSFHHNIHDKNKSRKHRQHNFTFKDIYSRPIINSIEFHLSFLPLLFFTFFLSPITTILTKQIRLKQQKHQNQKHHHFSLHNFSSGYLFIFCFSWCYALMKPTPNFFTLIIFVQWGRVSGYPRSRFSSLFLPRYFILLQLLFSVIFSHIIFCFWFCCCLLFYFWLCFFILEPLRYFSVLFSHIFLVFSWFWFHLATINFLSWFFYWSHHLIIVFDFAFICSHIYFIVVLFSHDFYFIIFADVF